MQWSLGDVKWEEKRRKLKFGLQLHQKKLQKVEDWENSQRNFCQDEEINSKITHMMTNLEGKKREISRILGYSGCFNRETNLKYREEVKALKTRQNWLENQLEMVKTRLATLEIQQRMSYIRK